jgi:hypothetical protein
MDQNSPITTSEPVQKSGSVNGIISLVTGILAWILTIIFMILDFPTWIAGILAFISAILAIVYGNKAKREDKTNRAGKTGRTLGWLYIILGIVGVILLVLGLVLGISALAGLFK